MKYIQCTGLNFQQFIREFRNDIDLMFVDIKVKHVADDLSWNLICFDIMVNRFSKTASSHSISHPHYSQSIGNMGWFSYTVDCVLLYTVYTNHFPPHNILFRFLQSHRQFTLDKPSNDNIMIIHIRWLCCKLCSFSTYFFFGLLLLLALLLIKFSTCLRLVVLPFNAKYMAENLIMTNINAKMVTLKY